MTDRAPERPPAGMTGRPLGRKKAERAPKQAQTRIGAGICPCCNRTFSQLARHMQSKHPDVPLCRLRNRRRRVVPERITTLPASLPPRGHDG